MDAADLKPAHRTFAEKVAEGMTYTDAYLASGFDATTRKNAQRTGWRLSQNPEIAAYIKELRQTAAARSQAETTLTIEEKLSFLARSIKTGAGAIQGEHELCQSFRRFSDGSISIRTPCKLKAIKLHCELSGDLDAAKIKRHPEATRDPLQELIDQIRRGQPDAFDHPVAAQ